jgi:hypothetical protein
MSTEQDKEALASMDKDDEMRRKKHLNKVEKLAPITRDDISFVEPKSTKRSDKELREKSLDRTLKPVPEPHSKT